MYRILIIEDDNLIAGIVRDQLNKWGYEARAVEDFSNVMSEFGSFSPHLVLMDITLPFYNGYHWCNEIRRIGIEPADLPRIFEQGYTGYNGRADKKSTGIGLYLCREICQKLGHGISAESRLGEGTTICLNLSSVSVEARN